MEKLMLMMLGFNLFGKLFGGKVDGAVPQGNIMVSDPMTQMMPMFIAMSMMGGGDEKGNNNMFPMLMMMQMMGGQSPTALLTQMQAMQAQLEEMKKAMEAFDTKK